VSERAPLVPPVVVARAASTRRFPLAFGPRFFLALSVGLVWLGPAWWDRRFAYAMLAWDALVLVAWLGDLRRLPPPAEIEIRRRWLAPLSLSVGAEVVLEIRNHSAMAFSASLIDQVPPSWCREPPQIDLEVSPSGSAQGTYAIRPSQRGDLTAGGAFLRYRTPWKLAERWARAALRQTVRVYPNLLEPKRHTLYLIRSRQIELEKRLKRQPGIGREFESLREYRGGDEPRDICWTATARRGKLISRVYQAERSQSVLIVADAGRLMLALIGGESEPLTKLDCAVNAALVLAHLALASGDRVGLLAYGRKIQANLAAARGAAHLRAMLERLALVRGELAEADHATAADLLLKAQRPRGLVVWLTDLAETAANPEVIDAAARLQKQHLVLFVAIGQPQLRMLVARLPQTTEEMYRYVAAQEMVQRREVLLRRLREQGALTVELNPGQLVTGLVNQYLMVKERGRL
jgi:uncharacterized protein (DUF58 family)